MSYPNSWARSTRSAAILEALRGHAAADATTFDRVIRDVTLPTAEGMVAFGQQDYATAADRLAETHAQLYRTGGSHAQRDVVVQTLIAAHLRAGRHQQALPTIDGVVVEDVEYLGVELQLGAP